MLNTRLASALSVVALVIGVSAQPAWSQGYSYVAPHGVVETWSYGHRFVTVPRGAALRGGIAYPEYNESLGSSLRGYVRRHHYQSQFDDTVTGKFLQIGPGAPFVY